MTLAPLQTDLSLYRDWARRVQAGTIPLDAPETGDVVETLCGQIEELRAYAEVLRQQAEDADRRSRLWAARIHQALGRLPLLHRHVQEVFAKHRQDKTLTAEETLAHIMRIVEREGAYQPR